MQFTEHADGLPVHFHFGGFARVQISRAERRRGVGWGVGNAAKAQSAQKEFDAALHVVEIVRRRIFHIPCGGEASARHDNRKFARLVGESVLLRLENGTDLE